MDDIHASDLKTILHSKRANLYYLQHCRVLVNGGRVEYITDEQQRSRYWNIPIANTTCLLLGTGTSITQAAMRELAKAGVMVGFCGGGGTPLFAGNEADIAVSWLSPQSEYRPTEYLQQWCRFWFNDDLRLEAARRFQRVRLKQIQIRWITISERNKLGFSPPEAAVNSALERFANELTKAPDSMTLLTAEARMTKQLYALAAQATLYDASFTRSDRGKSADPANRFLDHGNYLAYGLAATACWVLGLPHGMAVLHGKTRRGGLVFDVADLIKDAFILPQAFVSAARGDTEQEFRQACIERLTRGEALEIMIETLQDTAAALSQEALQA